MLANRQTGEDRVFLRHPHHPGPVDAMTRPVSDVDPVKMDGPGHREHSHQGLEEGRLAGSVATHDTNHFTLGNRERDSSQDRGRSVSGSETLDGEDGRQCSLPRKDACTAASFCTSSIGPSPSRG